MTSLAALSPQGQPLQQAEWRLLQIYLYYRFSLAIALLLVYLLFKDSELFADQGYPGLYLGVVLGYLVLTISALLWHRFLQLHTTAVTTLVVLIDILAIGLLEYSRGGGSGNLTVLLVVSVAAGGILIQGKIATFFAAFATLVVLYRQWLDTLFNNNFYQQDFMQSALIGIACFVTSIFAQIIARRLRESNALAGQQAKDLANLEALNHLIIQRMRTGIIVTDPQEQVILINDASWKLFSLPKLPLEKLRIDQLSKSLGEQFRQWQQDHHFRPASFHATPSGPDIQANFTSMTTGDQENVLIFLEDNSRLAQHAQQLKLASLGGLTASIAHEIRNPLGAISHAAQLLQESDQLTTGDSRLAEIIHQHGNRMNRIIENVLQLSRRRPTQAELYDMENWLNGFVEDYCNNLAPGADIDVRYLKSGLKFRIDQTQIQQVLTNLFTNGLRYSEKQTGKKTLLVVADLNTQSEQPQLDIIDQGIGVPETEQDKIFEPFYTSEKTGTGLGLYIARELCEANRARLNLIPNQGGACFRITFSHPARIMSP